MNKVGRDMNAHKCNLILAGFAKCGTSSLHEYLALHPRISMSRLKEPHYFTIENNWNLGSDFHNSLFEPNEKNDIAYFGESSTTYSPSDVALKRIKDQLYEPKIIFIVRDPVERVISHYRWMYALGLEVRPILKALEEDGFDFDPNCSIRGNYKSYLQFSAYSKYIPIWQEVIGENNVIVLFTDELAKKPQIVLDRCFSFLDIPTIEISTEIKNNQTEKSARVELRSLAKGAVKFTPQSVRKAIKKIPLIAAIWKTTSQIRISVKPPTINAEDRSMIEAILADEIIYYHALKTKHSIFD